LVKTGAKHAETIKEWFGKEAVEVPRFMPFSWPTRRSKPLETWSEPK